MPLPPPPSRKADRVDLKKSPRATSAQPPEPTADTVAPAVAPSPSPAAASAAIPAASPPSRSRRTGQRKGAAPAPVTEAPAAAAPTPATAAAKPTPRRRSTHTGQKRLFVLDTNVLMHDPSCLFRFEEHDIFLPMIVLEELDNNKKGMSEVARNARQASRTLDALAASANGDIRQGLTLAALGNGEASGTLFFQTELLPHALPDDLPQGKADNQILSVVQALKARHPDRDVVLVSKDINMRIKARALGLAAEDYENDKTLDDADMLYTGALALPPDFWTRQNKTVESWQQGGHTFYRIGGAIVEQLLLNQFVYYEAPGEPPLYARVVELRGKTAVLRTLKDYTHLKNAVWGVAARNREQNFALNLLMDPDIDFVTLAGTAGTGKTLMALAAGLTQVLDERRYGEIIMTRATVSVGEDIGFLPGTEEEKMGPWMGALDDNLEFLAQGARNSAGEWGRAATNDLIRSRVKIKSMNFMRGRTFLNKYVIIDEAQNLTPKQMKTLITRAGPGTKLVCMGNLAQIDTPYLTEGSSGLTYVVDRFKGWPHGGHVTLARGERSRLADFASEVL
ncbi:phosphate starvation-inducible protein PhoH [Tepidimonas fonticaldi]|uniref:Phosphate starvation-inducible protein PhoH n=1 Tax=Tepidimonas fonticaldi TaxID=1101373 RepID=A0A1A6DSG5_9BURK|nr:PhoH family protein [Tepidimonas fonticaldi]OBS29793.1 phosphate starvation-inducible protein PhoH [Tepidimonas fonticaldi]